MTYPAKVYKIMIASPGDVEIERNIIRDVIHEWNSIHSECNQIVLMPIGWETHAVPMMGDRPQEIINSQILESCDLLVAVFWTRIGTSTGKAISGTVEEIEEHIALGKPAMLYFSGAPVRLDSVDEEQYSGLKEFKTLCHNMGLVETYESPNQFREKFSIQLGALVNSHDIFNILKQNSENNFVSKGPDIPLMSKESRHLLIEASNDPTGTVMKLSTLGGFSIQTNGKQFGEPGNPRSRAIWEGAVDELCCNNFLEPKGYKGELFMVTREGYDMSDLIK